MSLNLHVCDLYTTIRGMYKAFVSVQSSLHRSTTTLKSRARCPRCPSRCLRITKVLFNVLPQNGRRLEPPLVQGLLAPRSSTTSTTLCNGRRSLTGLSKRCLELKPGYIAQFKYVFTSTVLLL